MSSTASTIVSTLTYAIARPGVVAAGFAVFAALHVGTAAWACEGEVFDSERERFCVHTLVRGLEHQ